MTFRTTLGIASLLGATALMAAASRLHVAGAADDSAMVRITWSARPERIERCIEVSAEELAQTPVHMRQALTCEGVSARYIVEVRHAGRMIALDTIQGGGLRRDRQLYHFRELRVPPGHATLEVQLNRADLPEGASGPANPAIPENPADSARARRRADELPPRLSLRAHAHLAPRQVVLVTYDREARQLRAVDGSQ